MLILISQVLDLMFDWLSYLPPQCSQPLLLGMRVDVCPNHERHDIEERDPCILREKFLGKRQCQGRGDPTDFHDWHEPSSDSGAHLMECPGASDDCHRDEVDGILNGRNLANIFRQHDCSPH